MPIETYVLEGVHITSMDYNLEYSGLNSLELEIKYEKWHTGDEMVIKNIWLKASENRRKIDFIMDNFNFEKVHYVMDALNWTWVGEGVPDISSLKSQARRLLEYIAEEKDCEEMSCGGFKAELIEEDFRLTFCVEEAESWVMDD